MRTGAVCVNCHLRDALGCAARADWLANDQSPAFEAGVLPGGDYIAFNAREQHTNTISRFEDCPPSRSVERA